MRLTTVLAYALTLLSASSAGAKSAWSFEDATISIQSKGAGVGAGVKEKFSPASPLTKAPSFGSQDTLKILLTTTEDKKAKMPHQAFLTLHEQSSGLDESFVFSVKESGKGKVELTHKDLPIQLLTTTSPLRASLIIASFGSSTPFQSTVFDLDITRDQSIPIQEPPAALRYGKLDEIHHIFRADPSSPPPFFTAIFACFVLAALPVLGGTWMKVGGNFYHLPEAVSTAPMAYALFIGSIFTLEWLFLQYYLGWTLFKTLPAVAAVGSVTFLSGSRALSEVQGRRLAGKR